MPSAPQGFDVAVERLHATRDELSRLHALLSAVERERARRFRFEHPRRRFIVARARLRQLLGARLGVPPQSVDLHYGKNGKPRLLRDGCHFSVSHCDDVALLAFSTRSEIGVDLEALRAIPEADAIAARFFSPREREAYAALRPGERPQRFLEYWTRKEALAKATGEGLSALLDAPDPSPAPGWRVHSFSPLPGFIAAVACHPA